MARQNDRRLLVVLLMLGLLARLGAVFFLGVPELIQTTESGRIAARLVAGQGYTFDFYGYRTTQPLTSFVPPLYTLLIAACLRLSSRPDVLLGIVQALLSTLTILAVYAAGQRLVNPPARWLATAAVAFYPVFIIEAARPLSLTLNACLIAALAALVLHLPSRPHTGEEPASRRVTYLQAGLIGILVGLGTLSRSSMLGLLPGVVLWVGLNRRALPAWRRVAFLICALTLLTLAPWIVRNWSLHDRPLLSTNAGITFWNGNNPFTTGSAWDVYVERARAYTGRSYSEHPDSGIVVLKPYPLPQGLETQVRQLTEVELNDALFAAGLAFIRQVPRRWGDLMLQKLTSFWGFRPNIGESISLYQKTWILPYKIIYSIMLPLSLLGVVLCRRQWRQHSLIWYIFAYFTVIYVTFNVVTRYRWEVETFILLYASVASTHVLHQARGYLNRQG